MQFTEVAAEPLVGFHIQRLIAEEQNLVLGQRLMQLLDLTVAERLRERDAFNIGADARRHRRDTYGFIAHGRTFRSMVETRSRKDHRPHSPTRKIFLFEAQQLPCCALDPLQFIASPFSLMTAPHFLISRSTKLWR